MSSTIIPNATAPSSSSSPSSQKMSGTFTGTVYLDSPGASPASEMAGGHVFFTPSSRTYWHTHEKGQVLEVKMASGWICDRGGKPRKISAGDVILCDPGVEHWHGAAEGSAMKTTWLEEVAEADHKQ